MPTMKSELQQAIADAHRLKQFRRLAKKWDVLTQQAICDQIRANRDIVAGFIKILASGIAKKHLVKIHSEEWWSAFVQLYRESSTGQRYQLKKLFFQINYSFGFSRDRRHVFYDLLMLDMQVIFQSGSYEARYACLGWLVILIVNAAPVDEALVEDLLAKKSLVRSMIPWLSIKQLTVQMERYRPLVKNIDEKAYAYQDYAFAIIACLLQHHSARWLRLSLVSKGYASMIIDTFKSSGNQVIEQHALKLLQGCMIGTSLLENSAHVPLCETITVSGRQSLVHQEFFNKVISYLKFENDMENALALHFLYHFIGDYRPEQRAVLVCELDINGSLARCLQAKHSAIRLSALNLLARLVAFLPVRLLEAENDFQVKLIPLALNMLRGVSVTGDFIIPWSQLMHDCLMKYRVSQGASSIQIFERTVWRRNFAADILKRCELFDAKHPGLQGDNFDVQYGQLQLLCSFIMKPKFRQEPLGGSLKANSPVRIRCVPTSKLTRGKEDEKGHYIQCQWDTCRV